MFQYETITCKTADLSEQLNIKGKQGWGVETCQLMSNQAGVFVLLKKESVDESINILPGAITYIDPLKKRPGRKPGSKNKVKNARTKQD